MTSTYYFFKLIRVFRRTNNKEDAMDSQQSKAPQTVVKKVLVKRVKVLVKRPVSAPAQAAPAAPQPAVVKVPVKRPVQPPMPLAAQTAQAAVPPPAQQPKPISSGSSINPSSKRQSFAGRIINGVEVKALHYELPDNILEEVERKEKVTDKLFLLYIYARLYSQQVAREEGYAYPPMMVELPEDTLQAAQMQEEVDDDLFTAILDDFIEMAPFISGMERIMANKAPLEQIIQSEMRRIKDQETLSAAQQILIAYLTILVDMHILQEKMDMLDIKNESDQIVADIKEMEENERELKQSFIDAIERKRFPVDARKLVNNYFTLAKKDPDKAYETLITNPLFFSPIQLERLPKKLFGLVKPSPNDAKAVNKQLASFLKNLKV